MEFAKEKQILLLVLFYLFSECFTSGLTNSDDLTITSHNKSKLNTLLLNNRRDDDIKGHTVRRKKFGKIRHKHRKRHLMNKNKYHHHPVNNVIFPSYPDIWSPFGAPILANALPNALIASPSNIIVHNGLSPLWHKTSSHLENTRQETDLLRRKYRLLLDKMGSRGSSEPTTTPTTQSMPTIELPTTPLPQIENSVITSSPFERSVEETPNTFSTNIPFSTPPSSIAPPTTPMSTIIIPSVELPTRPMVYLPATPYYTYIICPYYINLKSIHSYPQSYPQLFYYPIIPYYYFNG